METPSQLFNYRNAMLEQSDNKVLGVNLNHSLIDQLTSRLFHSIQTLFHKQAAYFFRHRYGSKVVPKGNIIPIPPDVINCKQYRQSSKLLSPLVKGDLSKFGIRVSPALQL